MINMQKNYFALGMFSGAFEFSKVFFFIESYFQTDTLKKHTYVFLL